MKLIYTFLILTFLNVFAVSAFAKTLRTDLSSKNLLDATTLCESPNNPLDALKELHGDYFTNVSSGVNQMGTVIVADVISNPAIRNTAIQAPARIVGKIQIIKGYQMIDGQPGAHLFCEMKVLN